MESDKNNCIWVVVKAESGIPVSVEAFLTQRDAENTEELIRSSMNHDNDETGVFGIKIPIKNRNI